MSSLIIEGFVYLASLLLALSLMVNNDLKFRWLNTAGCMAFIVYGVLINAFPIILTNTTLLVINLYTLLKIYKKKEAFDLVALEKNNPVFEKFFHYYEPDINAYFPNYHLAEEGNMRFIVLRDMAIANAFVAEVKEGIAEVKLNYTVPKYRDFKVGRFIFEKEKDFLLSQGINTIVYKEVPNKNHKHFLEVMGFINQQQDVSTYLVKQLK